MCLMIGLWILATGDTFRSTGVTFGVSRGVVFFHYIVLIEALREMAPAYVFWPDAVERDGIKTRYEEKYGYPGVVGCIDGTHIYISAPTEQPMGYINRHHSYSIIAQAVCDDRLLVRDVYVGEPGSVGDARTFSRSPLLRNLITRPELLQEDEHILGDGAYPLSKFVLTPYLDDAHLDERQRYHNYILSRARSSIERVFGLWKGKFRRVKNMVSFNIRYAVDHVIASFVVHNFIILHDEQVDGAFGDGIPIEDNVAQPPGLYNENEARERGVYKREYIAQLLHRNVVAEGQR